MELNDFKTSIATNTGDVDATAYGDYGIRDTFKKLSIISTIVTVIVIIVIGIVTLVNKKLSKEKKSLILTILTCVGIGVIVCCFLFIRWFLQ